MAELKRILLVEDNQYDVELILAALAENNLSSEVMIVRDGAEALNYLYLRGPSELPPESYPAVVLLDLKLPKIDGLEVLERIKSDPALKSIPVVMLTSSREEPDITRCYQLGVNSYIVKPVNFEGFVEAVQQLGMYWLLLNQPPKLER